MRVRAIFGAPFVRNEKFVQGEVHATEKISGSNFIRALVSDSPGS
jgi:hypothetical protein